MWLIHHVRAKTGFKQGSIQSSNRENIFEIWVSWNIWSVTGFILFKDDSHVKIDDTTAFHKAPQFLNLFEHFGKNVAHWVELKILQVQAPMFLICVLYYFTIFRPKLLISVSGKLYVFGDGSCGQLGLGTKELQSDRARQLTGIFDNQKIVTVGCGENYSAALTG